MNKTIENREYITPATEILCAEESQVICASANGGIDDLNVVPLNW